jgi:hypothetical protein
MILVQLCLEVLGALLQRIRRVLDEIIQNTRFEVYLCSMIVNYLPDFHQILAVRSRYKLKSY